MCIRAMLLLLVSMVGLVWSASVDPPQDLEGLWKSQVLQAGQPYVSVHWDLFKGLRHKRATSRFSIQQMKQAVDKHNALRAQEGAADMYKLSWSQEIADRAQEQSDSCIFDHWLTRWGSTVVGQNLYAYTGGDDVDRAIQAWYDEKADYDFGTGGCSGVCGHYTQVVWAGSKRVGCGVKFCPTLYNKNRQAMFNNAYYITCNYDPPGNWLGEKPYKPGTPCRSCASGKLYCSEGKFCMDSCSGEDRCECRAYCYNGGQPTGDCQCSCPKIWGGASCTECPECKDKYTNCQDLCPWWPEECAKSCGRCPSNPYCRI